MRDDLKNHIEKYLRGELSASEMHALEKRALDDPFLADALEGAMQLDAAQFASDIKGLSEKIISRSEKKVIPMWVWPARIAAGLAFIVVSMYVIINLIQKDSSTPLALNETQKTQPVAPEKKEELKNNDPSQSSPTEEARDSYKDTSKGDLAVSEPKAEPALGLKPASPESKPTIEKTIDDGPLLAQQETESRGDKVGVVTRSSNNTDGYFATKDTVKVSNRLSYTLTPPASQPVFKAEEDVAERSKQKADTRTANNQNVSKSIQGRAAGVQIISLKKVSGRVTFSEDSTGLPGVNVVIKGTNTGTVTDMNGNYEIDLDDPDATLVYSFIGLESKEIPVENESSVNVLMDQDVAQLSEVVVTGFGEGSNDDDKIYSTFEMAEPVGGRRAFKKYLEERLVYPRQALDNKIEGKVTIQFTVETTGKLTNFNVVKGIGYGCDDEVIRLIKQGPKWSATKRNDEPVKGKVKVRMRFTLPKKK